MDNLEQYFEEVVMPIVASAGEAKSLAMQALRECRTKNYDKGLEYIAKAKVAIGQAHHSQTTLMQDELNGKPATINLLMIHAQDHLMTAMLAIDLIEETIEQKKLG